MLASDCPASPPTVKIIDICAPRIACAATSTATLRRARGMEHSVGGAAGGRASPGTAAESGEDRSDMVNA
ncbi:hypothetical protein GCM10011341_09540 [Frigidibacter albus]|nr:hypothetical protein GCM10011341_09540 [Frigidibacter albus]